MILGEPALLVAEPPQSGVTIDDVFRRIARERGDALALADAPNRETFTEWAPRRLTYAQADRTVAAIAGRLRRIGLPTDSIVGIQLPNTVENILTFLGVLRAGLIAAPLPVLWRHADAVAALGRVGAKALITCTRMGNFDHSRLAMRVALEVFSIRQVCAFGASLPDDVTPLDDLFTAATLDPLPALDRERHGNPAMHVAAITFDMTAGGPHPIARNHLELLAGGVEVLAESGLPDGAVVLSTLVPASFAGIAVTLLPWLLTGGSLHLHHPFDADVLLRQWHEECCAALILPGPVAFRLAEAGAFADKASTSVIAPWRSPERLVGSPAWREQNAAFVDVQVFGEAGLVAARRGLDGRPTPIRFGAVAAPRGGPNGTVVVELMRTPTGTVALRGPMVPHFAFPPGVERSDLPHLKISKGGLIDSGYPCRLDSATDAMVVTGPPAGLVSIGGYRFPLHDLKDAVTRLDAGATLAALPDPLVGRRLIGNAADRDGLQAALNAAGFNPLVIGAFRDRSGQSVAANG